MVACRSRVFVAFSCFLYIAHAAAIPFPAAIRLQQQQGASAYQQDESSSVDASYGPEGSDQAQEQASVGQTLATYSIGQNIGAYNTPTIGSTLATYTIGSAGGYLYDSIGSVNLAATAADEVSSATKASNGLNAIISAAWVMNSKLSKLHSVNKTSSDAATSFTSKPSNLSGCEADDFMFLYNMISQIKKAKLSNSKLLSGVTINGTSKTSEFFQNLVLAVQPNATSAQKALVKKVDDTVVKDDTKVQKALFDVAGGFSLPFSINQILYKGVKTYRGAYEVMNAELPNVAQSVSSADRVKFLAVLLGYSTKISKSRYSQFKSAVTKYKADDSLKKNGFQYNDTTEYIKFSSSSSVKNLATALKNVNTDTKSSAFTSDLIQNSQISTEIRVRLEELTTNSKGA